MVAGKKSDANFEDLLQAHDGIVSSHVRDVSTARIARKKSLQKERQRGDVSKQRRKVQQYAKIKDAVNNSKAPARHRPNKLSPKDDCKSGVLPETKVPAKRARKTKARCKNCGLMHTGECIDPTYAKKERTAGKKRKKDEEDAKEMEEMYQVLFGS